MLNFYQKFFCGAAGVLAPLTNDLRDPGKSLTWSPALDSAFRRTKDLLASVPELVHPCSGAHISLAVDASDPHVGSVLQQLLGSSGFLLKEVIRHIAIRYVRQIVDLSISCVYYILFKILLYKFIYS